MKKAIFLGMLIMPFVTIGQTVERSVLASDGSFSAQSNLSISYTIGDIAVDLLKDQELSLQQGFQQVADVEVLTGIYDHTIVGSLAAYPNPTQGQLTLSIEVEKRSKLHYSLYDAIGRIVMKSEHAIDVQKNKFLHIHLDYMKPGIYHLLVTSESGEAFKSIKILKE
ncbi:T9SS type A sorting domain-containing protein [Fulvivirgaceae bacterium BMA10]|uniref:T9SS type A sorting domain-containing protein n=1 Tax=Splendidivirga corallicola TaxID=3051826 RepID=A0ABT8KW12_9BACT|nr:T9SS type A sorting domain-containing protein [Fulvivirgaceae bacterium BMA10]